MIMRSRYSYFLAEVPNGFDPLTSRMPYHRCHCPPTHAPGLAVAFRVLGAIFLRLTVGRIYSKKPKQPSLFAAQAVIRA